MVEEIWKDVVGYEDLYQVSNMGNVKRKISRRCLIERIIAPTKSHGYMRLGLCRNNKVKMHNVHRLVAMAFIPNPECKPFVNHMDGNKKNNSIDNLEWVTAQENTRHAYNVLNRQVSSNVCVCGAMHPASKPIEQLDLQNNLIREWENARMVENELGFWATNIAQCLKGKINTSHGFKWRYK